MVLGVVLLGSRRRAASSSRRASAISVTLLGLAALASVSLSASDASYLASASSGSNSFLTATLDPPTDLVASSGDGAVDASWTPPANGGAVVGYTVSAVPAGGGAPHTCSTVTPATACTVTGLINGVAYDLTVVATVSNWYSAASIAASALPYPKTVMTAVATELWLDGADSSRLFTDSACTTALTSAGQTVGCWKDRSTNAINFVQATAANRPTATSVNSRTVATFDGTNDSLSGGASLLPIGTSTSTVFAVARLTDPSPTTSSWREVFSYGSSTNDNGRFVEKVDNSSLVSVEAYGPTLTDGNWSGSGNQVVAGQWASGTMSLWNSGRPTVSAARSFNTGSTYANVGSENGGYVWHGPISEIIVLSTAPTAAERRSIEEYLARKWTAAITPQAPASVTATPASSTSASVSWAAPAWDGGAAVTSYTATASPGGRTCTTSATSCTITTMSAGGIFTVTVKATNSVGLGPASAGASVDLP